MYNQLSEMSRRAADMYVNLASVGTREVIVPRDDLMDVLVLLADNGYAQKQLGEKEDQITVLNQLIRDQEDELNNLKVRIMDVVRV